MPVLPGPVRQLLSQPRSGQNPASPSTNPKGRIAGVVLDGTTRSPVRGATVRLLSANRNSSQTLRTTDAGAFSFQNLTARESRWLAVQKEDCFDARYPEPEIGNPTPVVLLEESESLTDVTVLLWRKSAIGGEVRLPDGQPLANALMSALPVFTLYGRSMVAPGQLAITDSKGAYRIDGLAGGRYVVTIYPRSPAGRGGGASSPTPMYSRQFYPGVETLGEAQAVELAPGDEHLGVNFQAVATAPRRIAGKVVGPAGSFSMRAVRLVTTGSEDLGRDHTVAVSKIGSDGSFRFDAVPAGHYTLQAARALPFLICSVGSGERNFVRGVSFDDLVFPAGPGPGQRLPPPNTSDYFGSVPLVATEHDVLDVALPIQNTGSVNGNVVVEGESGLPSQAVVRLIAESPDGDVGAGMPSGEPNTSDSTRPFTIGGLLPYRYLIRVAAPRGWVVKAITLNGADYTYDPFDFRSLREVSGLVVTLTDKAASLSGTLRYREVRVAGTQRRPGCVVAFPVERSQWSGFGFFSTRIRAERADDSGVFRIRDLPAGAYYVAALDRCPRGEFQQTNLLETLAARARRVELAWGVETPLDLEIEKRQ